MYRVEIYPHDVFDNLSPMLVETHCDLQVQGNHNGGVRAFKWPGAATDNYFQKSCICAKKV